MSCTGGTSLIYARWTLCHFSYMIEGSYRSWDLYTTGQLVDGLQQKKKTGFHETEMEVISSFSRPTILSLHPVYKSKVGNRRRGWLKGSLFTSYYTKMCREGSTPFPVLLYFNIGRNLINCVLSKVVSSTIFLVFGMTRPGIELCSPGHCRTRNSQNQYMLIYMLQSRGLSSLVGKFAGWHISWNAMALLRNWARPGCR